MTKTSKLSDTQLIVLSAAAARDDGYAMIPEKMTKAAAAKIGASLVARKLMREIKAKPDMPVWRKDEENRGFSLVLTAAGRKAIHVEDQANLATGAADADEQPAMPGKASSSKLERPTREIAEAHAGAPSQANGSAPRAGSKQALVIDMLSAKTGTTIDALIDATGWLPHTTRAALTGLRKRGFSVTRERVQGKPSIYRIEMAAAAAA